VPVRFGSGAVLNSLIVLSLFWFISCGATPGRLTTSASSKAANLTINAKSLDFGSVAIGSSKSSAITLSNSSALVGRNVLVSKILASGFGFALKSPALPITLSAGQSLPLTVTFTPRSAGTNNGQLSVWIQGGSRPVLVALSGVGLGVGQLGANPSNINFGTVAIGATKNQNGFVTAGAKDVRISSASWNGQGYSISGIGFPIVVPAKSSIRFTVTFAPESSGTLPGQISFFTNSSVSPTVVNLSGTGTESVQHRVSLSWNASRSHVAGYNIYRRLQSERSYVRLNRSLNTSLMFTDDTVQSGMTYYYAVTSVDAHNHESTYSNLAKADIL
jgi:Abnormal spindle-like microcephaly-assoc'd, ASPM-SPD-2-Hydin